MLLKRHIKIASVQGLQVVDITLIIFHSFYVRYTIVKYKKNIYLISRDKIKKNILNQI